MARSGRRVHRVYKVKYRPRQAARPAEEQPDSLPAGYVNVFVVDNGVERPETIRLEDVSGGDLNAVAAIEAANAAAFEAGTKFGKSRRGYVMTPAVKKSVKVGKRPEASEPSRKPIAGRKLYYSAPQGFENVAAGTPDDGDPSEYSAQHASAAARIRLMADQKAGRDTADWIVKLAGH